MKETERIKDETSASDEALAGAFQRGDTDAFSVLVARSMRMIRRLTARFGGIYPFERDDLLQEGLLGLLFAARTFSPSGGAAFSTYAYRCTENRILDAVRNGQNRANRVLNTAVPLESLNTADSLEDPETLVERRETLSGLLQAGLSGLEQRVLRLYLGGYARESAARMAGVSLSAYDNALARARRKLKR